MKRIDLVHALEQVKPGLASKEIIQQTTSFAFIAGGVVTYNDEISISCPIKGLDIEGVVQAEELYKFLNKVKADNIEMTCTDSEVRIKAGKSKVGLTLHREITLPLDILNIKSKWKKLPDNFIDALKFVLFSCSSDMSRPILTCINVRKDGVIESSDGFRLTQYRIPIMPTTAFLLPATAAQQLIKYKVIQIYHSDGWVHFRTENKVVFSCRIYEESFPNTKEHIKVEGTIIEFPKTVAEVLNRASIFAKRDHAPDEQVKLKLENRKITISSKSSTGWFEESASMKYKGDLILFAVNPTFLMGGIEKLRTCILGKNRIKFEGDDWIHIAALRVEED